MKKKIFLTLVLLMSAALAFIIPIKTGWIRFETGFMEENEEEEKESGVDKQLSWWFQARAYPDPADLNGRFLTAWDQAQAIKNSSLSKSSRMLSNWNWIGPKQNIGGRMLSIAIDPKNISNIFVGSASGGMWRTSNGGTSWSAVVTNLPVLGVPSISFHPVNSNILIAGTGEVYRVDTSNIGFNVWKARGTYGIGIIRSTDGGATWTSVFNKSMSCMFGVQKIKFDPNDANIVYACTTVGVFKSADAGATWDSIPILNKIYVADLAINPANSNIMVAAVGNLVNPDRGIYRTTDGGATWIKVKGGFPTTLSGFTKFDNAGSAILYASVGMNDNGEDELYISSDFGANWIAKSGSHHSEYQFWCAHTLAVNPVNSNEVVLGGVDLYRYVSTSTTTGTGSSSRVSTNSSPVHADIHDIKFVPGSGNTYYIACDGGIYKVTNWSGSPGYTEINNGLGATQFYASLGVSSNASNPYLIVGGLQDNGAWYYNGTTWNRVIGGDGGACAISPTSDNTVFASNDALTVNRSTGGAGGTFSRVLGSWAVVADDRTSFMPPIAISKSDPTRVYAASDNLHVSSSSGASGTWSNTSYSTATKYIDARYKPAIALAVSQQNKDKLYVSTSPFSQRPDNSLNVTGGPGVFKSLNGGAATPTYTNIKAGLPDRFVMDFAVHPADDNIVYVALGGYGSSHIFKTNDGGSTWTDMGGDGKLPDVPFNAVFIDPDNPRNIYAGCDLGVYMSPDGGVNWVDFNEGLPDVTMVMDIQETSDNQIVIATHGRGIWTSAKSMIILPARFSSIKGESMTGANSLHWQMAEESRLSHFEVERSTNGIDFSTIGTVQARNAGSYSFTDAPVTGQSFYYRIKSYDNTGIYQYSEVVYLKRTAIKFIQVAGNPFQSSFDIQFSGPEGGHARILLYDAAGKLLRSDYPYIEGQTIWPVRNLGSLPAGTYYLEVIFNSKHLKEKLLKK